MSERSAEPEPMEMTYVVDSGDHEEGIAPGYPRKNHINAYRRSTRTRKNKTFLNPSDFAVTTPSLPVHSQLQGPVDCVTIADDGITVEYPRKNHISAHCHPTRRRREESIIYISDSDDNDPDYCVQRHSRKSMYSGTSIFKDGILDSNIFPHYMEHIWSGVSEEKRDMVTYMDCLWFRSYAENLWTDKVLEWIKRRDIFSKSYVFVPIVMWSHWNLLIFCHFGESLQSKSRTPCMLLLDSLQTANPRRLESLIRKFVMDIYEKEERPETEAFIRKIPLLVPSVPQQIDGKKCGYFVLYYIHLFIENAPENFSINEGYPYFMKEDWFTLDGLDSFCRTLDSVSITSSSDE